MDLRTSRDPSLNFIGAGSHDLDQVCGLDIRAAKQPKGSEHFVSKHSGTENSWIGSFDDYGPGQVLGLWTRDLT